MLILGLSSMRAAAARGREWPSDCRGTRRTVRQGEACHGAAGVRLCDIDAVAVPWRYWQIGRRRALALGSMLRSPSLCWVKGKRSAERVA